VSASAFDLASRGKTLNPQVYALDGAPGSDIERPSYHPWHVGIGHRLEAGSDERELRTGELRILTQK
jgi:hypothetical protein